VALEIRVVSPLRPSDHVIVVGSGVAGWRFVETLRREGYSGALTLIGEEPHPPYDRPPLSKQVLTGKWTIEKATLATPEKLSEANATLRLGLRATRLDAENTSVFLADGSSVEGTHVVLATGVSARQLSFPSSGTLATLRNYDDLKLLTEKLDSLAPESIVAIIGGGFIGAEVATAVKGRGLQPVVLEVAARPLVGVVGEEASTWLGDIGTNFGVEVRTNQRLRDVVPGEGGFEILFDDGPSLLADFVLAAVGSSLDLAWLEGSGLTLDQGVVVDRDFQAAPNVAAIGDIARFVVSSALGEEVARIEHWEVAIDHAAQLARLWVVGERSTAVTVPYFWSDQYGKKIQMLGHPHPSDDVVMVTGSREEAKWLALYSRDGFVTGALSLSQPRALALSKPLLEEPTPLSLALSSTPWSV
jgi:3-phenylpropionate/trans-cinnamate dioxygenase ferredoxin reductase subunit